MFAKFPPKSFPRAFIFQGLLWDLDSDPIQTLGFRNNHDEDLSVCIIQHTPIHKTPHLVLRPSQAKHLQTGWREAQMSFQSLGPKTRWHQLSYPFSPKEKWKDLPKCSIAFQDSTPLIYGFDPLQPPVTQVKGTNRGHMSTTPDHSVPLQSLYPGLGPWDLGGNVHWTSWPAKHRPVNNISQQVKVETGVIVPRGGHLPGKQQSQASHVVH